MIKVENLSKNFEGNRGQVKALDHINLTVQDGEIYGIIGMSGAGKSTLVRCLNFLEKPTEGSVFIDDVDLGSLEEKELRGIRRKVAMIFQQFNLLMQRTCLENVTLPLEFLGEDKQKARKRAMELLSLVGLPDKADAYPVQLSGGQKQRVAVARALATNPEILLCDEATSALDPTTTNSILQLLRKLNEQYRITIVLITHQMSVVEEICQRVAIIDKGHVVEEGPVSEIFSRPKSEAAKRLVFPESINDIPELTTDSRFLRVVFNGAETTGQPLIARMAKELGVEASIVSAQTKSLGERMYGSMILSFWTDTQDFDKAVSYLSEVPDLVTEEIAVLEPEKGEEDE